MAARPSKSSSGKNILPDLLYNFTAFIIPFLSNTSRDIDPEDIRKYSSAEKLPFFKIKI